MFDVHQFIRIQQNRNKKIMVARCKLIKYPPKISAISFAPNTKYICLVMRYVLKLTCSNRLEAVSTF